MIPQGQWTLASDTDSILLIEVLRIRGTLVLRPAETLEPNTTYAVQVDEPLDEEDPPEQMGSFRTGTSDPTDPPAPPVPGPWRAHSDDYFVGLCDDYADWIELSIERPDGLALLAVTDGTSPSGPAQATTATTEQTLTAAGVFQPGTRQHLFVGTLSPNGVFSGWVEGPSLVMPPTGTTTTCATDGTGTPSLLAVLLVLLGVTRRPWRRRRSQAPWALAALSLAVLLPAQASADWMDGTRSTSRTRAGTQLEQWSIDHGIAAGAVGATCILPAVGTAFRAPISGEALLGCLALAAPWTVTSLVMAGHARGDRGMDPRALARRYTGLSVGMFAMGGLMAGASVPATLADVFSGGPKLVFATIATSITGFHLGMLFAVLAERARSGGRSASRRGPWIVAGPLGVVGRF